MAGFGDGSGVLGGVIAEMVGVAYSEGHPGFHLRLRAILGWVKSLED